MDMRKVYKWGIKEAVTGLKKSTADEKHLIAMSLGNRKKSSKELTQDLRDGSGLTAGPSTKSSLKPYQKWFQREGGFKLAILKEGHGEKSPRYAKLKIRGN